MGFFHADPHPGNVFVFEDGSLGLIDFGAVGRLDAIQQQAVLEMLVGMVRRDVSLLREAIEQVVDVAETAPRERLERALARLLAQNVRATGTVEPTVFQDLIHLLGEFGLRLPGDLVLLSRVLVTVDGTIRVLAPEVSMVVGRRRDDGPGRRLTDRRPGRDAARGAGPGAAAPAAAARPDRSDPDPRRAGATCGSATSWTRTGAASSGRSSTARCWR